VIEVEEKGGRTALLFEVQNLWILQRYGLLSRDCKVGCEAVESR
jgi:hypothetical protein